MADKTNGKPRAVTSHDITLDKEYVQWIHDIKQRFRNAQIKAAVKVNSEQLLLTGSWEGILLCVRLKKNGAAALLNR